MTEVEEKRKAKRFNCRVPVMCKKGTAFDNSQTIDISKAGVGLVSNKFIPVDTRMILEIALSPHSDPVLALGQVRWARRIPVSDTYRIGMHFADIAGAARSQINNAFSK